MKWLERHLSSVSIAVVIVNVLTLFIIYYRSVADRSRFMALISGIGLVIAIILGAFLVLIPDDSDSQATERLLSVSAETFEHMRGGLTYDTCRAACELILPETGACAVSMTSTEMVLGYAGEQATLYPPGSRIHTKETLSVLRSGQVGVFSRLHVNETAEGAAEGIDLARAVIIVPLIVREETVGVIKFYYHNAEEIDRSQAIIARGFGQLISTQLNAFVLDRQAELTALAEVKALQAQINPHFLFNTLNTISSFTRTDPDRARDLLRDLATFYRQTLENSETSIPLSREIEQTERYLSFEVARFGEERISVKTFIEEELRDFPVPGFIVQPIVENSVRHAMRDEGTLHIEIHAATDGDDVLISVIDDGVGMDESASDALFEDRRAEDATGVGAAAPEQNAGTGVALRNVAERVKRFYDAGSGVEVVSRPDAGTSVTLRLVNAAIHRNR